MIYLPHSISDSIAESIPGLSERFWLAELAGVILLMLGALGIYGWAVRVMLRRAQKTKTPWDDVILRSINAPAAAAIAGIGMLQIAEILLPPALAEWRTGLGTAQNIVLIGAIYWLLWRLTSRAELVLLADKRKWQAKRDGDSAPLAVTVQAILRVTRVAILIIAILTAVESFGVSVSGILAFGGIGGLVVGLALKDLLSNFFGGMLIFWDRPFVVNDWIRVPESNIEGTVENIGWRLTRLRTFDHRPLYVPNAIFANQVIENPQRMTNRRIYENMGLRYEDLPLLAAVLEDIRAMLKSHSGVDAEKTLLVYFDSYGESSVNFFVYAMTRTTDWQTYHAVKEDVLFKIAEIVSAKGAEFAFPTRTLHHTGAPPPIGREAA